MGTSKLLLGVWGLPWMDYNVHCSILSRGSSCIFTPYKSLDAVQKLDSLKSAGIDEQCGLFNLTE